MPTSASADKLTTFQVSDAVASTHGAHAINPFSGDICVAYAQGASPKTIKCGIYKRIAESSDEAPQYSGPFTLTLATPAGALTPSAGASPSCSHPWVAPIEDGFVVFWERKDTTIAATTMTAGGAQIEMCKLVAEGSGYRKYASDTAGKGWVLDNTVIAGLAGGTPRCAWSGLGNIVGVVYGSQISDSLAVDDHQRTYAVRAAYLDFSAVAGVHGKPVFVTNGNRTGGSAVGEATDGGYAAGAGALITPIDLDDDEDTPSFAGGGGLPHCCFDMRGDFAVVSEFRNGKAGTGGIGFRIFKGPLRSTGLDAAAIYSSVVDLVASAAFAARRPIIAFRNARDAGAVVSSTANFPPLLVTYGNVDPTAATVNVALAKTITFPINGAAPTYAALVIPANTNYDATADAQALPTVVDSPFLTAAIVEENLAGVSGGEGKRFKVCHLDDDDTVEVFLSDKVIYPSRPNMQAATLADGTKIGTLTYEGQNTSGGGSEHVYLTIYHFA